VEKRCFEDYHLPLTLNGAECQPPRQNEPKKTVPRPAASLLGPVSEADGSAPPSEFNACWAAGPGNGSRLRAGVGRHGPERSQRAVGSNGRVRDFTYTGKPMNEWPVLNDIASLVAALAASLALFGQWQSNRHQYKTFCATRLPEFLTESRLAAVRFSGACSIVENAHSIRHEGDRVALNTRKQGANALTQLVKLHLLP